MSADKTYFPYNPYFNKTSKKTIINSEGEKQEVEVATNEPSECFGDIGAPVFIDDSMNQIDFSSVTLSRGAVRKRSKVFIEIDRPVDKYRGLRYYSDKKASFILYKNLGKCGEFWKYEIKKLDYSDFTYEDVIKLKKGVNFKVKGYFSPLTGYRK